MKILIIEDEALLAEGLRTLLELRGFEVETVSDGENGAEYAESGSYDLQMQGRSIKKETILTRVWGYDTNAGENNVEVYVGFLRKKLRAIGMEYSEDENAYLYTLGDESPELDDLLDKVEALSREGSAEGAEGLEELISFSFHAEGWDDVELTLYSYDSGSCLVEINGEALAFTERSSAEALRDAAAEALQAE